MTSSYDLDFALRARVVSAALTMKMILRITLFCLMAGVAWSAPELTKFDPPLISKDGALPSWHQDQPWMRAAYSEWMPWGFTFAEWKSYRSENYTRSINEGMFAKSAKMQRAAAKEGCSVFGALALKEGNGRFLVVLSCFGEVAIFPKTKGDLPYALRGLLMKREETGWKVVDLGGDVALGSPVAKEFLALLSADALGIGASPK